MTTRRTLDSTRWVYVTLDYATFALCIKNGVIDDGPPIAKWAIGKSEREVATYYRSKGAHFSHMPWDHQ